MTSRKHSCDDCKRKYRFRGMHWYKGKNLCYVCWRKKIIKVPDGSAITNLNWESAISRIYEVRDNSRGSALICIPKVLKGHRLRIMVVD